MNKTALFHERNKILDLPCLKAFANDKLHETLKMFVVFEKVENIVRKGIKYWLPHCLERTSFRADKTQDLVVVKAFNGDMAYQPFITQLNFLMTMKNTFENIAGK